MELPQIDKLYDYTMEILARKPITKRDSQKLVKLAYTIKIVPKSIIIPMEYL